MAVSETNVAATWIVSTLEADSELMSDAPGGIWEDYAPHDTPEPYIIFHLEPDQDLVITGAFRIWTPVTATVKVVAAVGSYLSLEDAATRIDAALHKGSGNVDGGMVVSCVRNMPLRYTEQADEAGVAVTYRHLGGEYAMQVQSR